MKEPIIIDSLNNKNKPYKIIKNGFKKNISIFEKIIKKTLIENGINETENLDELHKNCKVENINQIRLKIFKEINILKNWEILIYESIKPELHFALGSDLAIQTKLNLSIQMPKDKTSILEKHIDFRSGDSPFQLVAWIPLTNAFLTNSIFFDYEENKNFLDLESGDILLFDPNYPHGNQINNTQKTRISLNVRFKNWFSPDMEEKVPDRQFGIYYKDFCFSNSTIKAFKLIQENLE